MTFIDHQFLINNQIMTSFILPQGLAVCRLPLTKVCYVSKLDPTLPTPQKLKLDMELVCSVVVSYVMATIFNQVP